MNLFLLIVQSTLVNYWIFYLFYLFIFFLLDLICWGKKECCISSLLFVQCKLRKALISLIMAIADFIIFSFPIKRWSLNIVIIIRLSFSLLNIYEWNCNPKISVKAFVSWNGIKTKWLAKVYMGGEIPRLKMMGCGEFSANFLCLILIIFIIFLIIYFGFWVFSTLIECSDCIRCFGVHPPLKKKDTVCPGYDSKLFLLVRLQF